MDRVQEFLKVGATSAQPRQEHAMAGLRIDRSEDHALGVPAGEDHPERFGFYSSSADRGGRRPAPSD
jgi:hypothetical protein